MANDHATEETRGFERLDPLWHSQVDSATEVDTLLRLVRDFVASIPPGSIARLPESCRHLRVKCEDDLEYWTFKLSRRPQPGDAADAALLHDLFMHFLHASMRLAQIHRLRAESRP